MLFKALVRPKLEYNNSVWWTSSKSDIMKIEAVQRRATKMIPQLKKLPYTERLKILELPTLIYRRLRGDCIQVYKFMNGYYDFDWQKFFHINSGLTHSTRGHSLKLNKSLCFTKARRNFFAVRVINNWNSLPQSVISVDSINSFKNALDKH